MKPKRCSGNVLRILEFGVLWRRLVNLMLRPVYHRFVPSNLKETWKEAWSPKVFVGSLLKKRSFYIKFLKRLISALECMNVSLLYSNCWHVSTANVAIFRVGRTRIQPRERPKHIGGYYTIKLLSHTQVHLLVFKKKFIYLIKVRNTKHIKMRKFLVYQKPRPI